MSDRKQEEPTESKTRYQLTVINGQGDMERTKAITDWLILCQIDFEISFKPHVVALYVTCTEAQYFSIDKNLPRRYM
jgi:hypothetical protein